MIIYCPNPGAGRLNGPILLLVVLIVIERREGGHPGKPI
jgi:hypothetical protein